MTHKEHRKWIEHWIGIAEESLNECAEPKAETGRRMARLVRVMHALGNADAIIAELEKLESKESRWTASPQ